MQTKTAEELELEEIEQETQALQRDLARGRAEGPEHCLRLLSKIVLFRMKYSVLLPPR